MEVLIWVPLKALLGFCKFTGASGSYPISGTVNMSNGTRVGFTA